MNAMIRWLGGATAAVVLGFTGAAFATGQFTAPERPAAPAESATTLAQPAPADQSGFFTSPAQPRPARAERLTVKRVLPIDGPIKYGEWHWDDANVPDGPIVMTVDLDARVLSVFKGGYEIGAAAVLLGTDEYPTPLGTFPILRKQRHNVSEKYDNAPMPWSMFLTSDGVAIHGGHAIENGYASHGCISGPDGFISKIFAIVQPGDKVIVTRGEMLQQGDPIV
ncbi:L,D-transpeptidase family protein [Parafrankia sp. BMG5.11]|uniref:L,D-transpeptidase family protein n=1 Tax=Parafrankia sp. BMG5.11 TaxID=222540 RepID=UPI001039602E|nr:L,D-transpeptidase family protein [Parafrankia sp. BMG5.11]TCJ41474.1 L,D-transpeptidase [Parafrankia sp. BMG5.11]